jgi:hypothetical protein
VRRMTRWQPLAQIIILKNVSDIPTASAAEGDEIGLLVTPSRAPKLGWDGTSACTIRIVSERFMMTGDVIGPMAMPSRSPFGDPWLLAFGGMSTFRTSCCQFFMLTADKTSEIRA